jgi:Uma2 family endonuclease
LIVRLTPLDIVYGDDTRVQPDIMIFNMVNKNRKIPEAVIEVLSKSTYKRDQIHKVSLYKEMGVKEYWTVRPANGLCTKHIPNQEIKDCELVVCNIIINIADLIKEVNKESILFNDIQDIDE